MRCHGGRSGDAPVAVGVGDASSPGPGDPPNQARNMTRGEGVAATHRGSGIVPYRLYGLVFSLGFEISVCQRFSV